MVAGDLKVVNLLFGTNEALLSALHVVRELANTVHKAVETANPASG